MDKRVLILAGAGVGVAVAYALIQSGAVEGDYVDDSGADSKPESFFQLVGGLTLKLDRVFNSVAWANMRRLIPVVDQVRYEKNVVAFLHVIRHGESSHGAEAYQMMNGRESFAAPPWVHPCRVGAGGTSTAAGAYQALCKVWSDTAKEVPLSDFSPVNQERFAVYRMAWRGALQAVLDGDLDLAVSRCRKEWTSLPGATEQNQTMDTVRAVFVQYGGKLKAS